MSQIGISTEDKERFDKNSEPMGWIEGESVPVEP